MERREQPHVGCAPAGRLVELFKCEQGLTVHRPQPAVDMLLAHRIRLDPTRVQRDYFARAVGTPRRVWNSHAPVLKKKGHCRDSFYIANDKLRLEGKTHVLKDFMHKFTARLCRENQTVVTEDLNVRGMLANGRLSRAIANVGFHGFRRQPQYKADRYGTPVILADRWYPSSKLCSHCGTRYGELRAPDKTFRGSKCGALGASEARDTAARRIAASADREDSTLVRRDECNAAMEVLSGALTLGERNWTCSRCARHDRDVNAAINLKRLATGACAAQSALPVASQAATSGTAAGMGSAGGGKVTPARHEHGRPDGSGQEQNDAHFRAHF